MEDPKRQAWMYLIAGIVAIIAAIYFISTAGQVNDSFGILDYAILGMGVVAIYRGVRGFRDLRRADGGPTGSPTPGEGPKRIGKPGNRPSDGSGTSGTSGDS